MRTKTIIPTLLDDEAIKVRVGEFLNNCGYVFQEYKGMMVWKKGNGWLTSPMIFKIDREGTNINIESWIPMALLPGVYFGESGLDSFFGFALKGVMRDILKDLVSMIIAPDQGVIGYYPSK